MIHNQQHRLRLSQAAFLLCAVLFLAQGIRGKNAYWHSCDFAPIYAGARCMLSNCNPYSFTDVERIYYHSGGEHISSLSERSQPLVNPPTTLLLAMPLSLFPYPIAEILWLAASGLAFCCAVYCTLAFAEWAPSATALGCVLLITSPLLLMVGQVATIAIAAISIATTLLLRGDRQSLAIVLLALGVALKPHLVGLVLVYFILRDRYRARALRGLTIVVLLAIVSSLWVTLLPSSRNWFALIRANIAKSVAPGEINDPSTDNPDSVSMVNLQVDTSLFTNNQRLANLTAWLVSAVLIAAWLVGTARPHAALEDDILAVASVSCIVLLPVYHRLYDTRVLLVTIPAFALLLKRSRPVGFAAAVLTASVFLSTNRLYVQLCRRVDLFLGSGEAIPATRSAPLVVTFLAIIYLLVYLFRSRQAGFPTRAEL